MSKSSLLKQTVERCLSLQSPRPRGSPPGSLATAFVVTPSAYKPSACEPSAYDQLRRSFIEIVGRHMKNIFFKAFGSAALLRELKILSILEQSPKGMYALAIAKDAKADGIPSSTVYAILGRLYAKSLVETSDYEVPHKGPRRTIYKLSPHGYAVLRAAERESSPSELELTGTAPS